MTITIYPKRKCVLKKIDIFIGEINILDLNKLFATFCTLESLDEVIRDINKKYSILYKKIFILESSSSKELICTYNIDTANISGNLIKGTILLHRKKESNTLYTINALNTLIKSLNEGKLNKNFQVNWIDYKNSILLTTNDDELRKLDTKIYKVVNL